MSHSVSEDRDRIEAESGPRAADEHPSRLGRAFARTPVAFDIRLPDGDVRHFGRGPAEFHLRLNNRSAVRAVASLDEGRIADAYLSGDIDFDGDPLRPFALRATLHDRHFVTAMWRFMKPLLFGQVRTNKDAIAIHYEIDAEFFLSFLDPNTPCYTQGVYERPDETLEAATLRKFDYCYRRLGLKRGDHVLEIGPGWGAWFDYAAARGVKCTGISIAQASLDYLAERAKAKGYDWTLIHADLLSYRPEVRYDAIVIMGVIEHLPQYERVLAGFTRLLKPGGRIFLDASASPRKYELCSFMVKHIYPGNHSFLALHDFLAAMAKTPLRVLEMFNDSRSYYLTFLQWAQNLDRNRERVVERYGEYNFRRFRLYLWGAVYQFLTGDLDCYRMIIQYPEPSRAA